MDAPAQGDSRHERVSASLATPARVPLPVPEVTYCPLHKAADAAAVALPLHVAMILGL